MLFHAVTVQDRELPLLRVLLYTSWKAYFPKGSTRNNMPFQIKHECSHVLSDHCCWIMNSTAATHPSCVSCRLISWQRFIHFARERTKGGRQPSASHSRCWVCDKLTPVLVSPAEQNGTRASCSSPSSLEAHYLGTDIQENSCCSSPWWSCRLVPHSFTESPCGPCDTSCKSKWMPPTL